MLNKLLAVFSLLGLIFGGLLVYTNTAYFPMARGAELEQRVVGLEGNMTAKLDQVITLLKENQRG